jgi:hypothetical protein
MRRLIAQLRALLAEAQWHRPDVSRKGEGGELSRTRRTLKIRAKDLHAAVKTARVGDLSDAHWAKLRNTDSYKATRSDAHHAAKRYGRDVKKIFHGLKNGHKLPAPIVLHRKGKAPYLVAGNTRLMAASASKVRPKVLHVRLKK